MNRASFLMMGILSNRKVFGNGVLSAGSSWRLSPGLFSLPVVPAMTRQKDLCRFREKEINSDALRDWMVKYQEKCSSEGMY